MTFEAGDVDEFFELSLDLLPVTGLDGRLRRVNPSWTRVLGWTEAELLATPVIELVHPDDREATLAARGRLGEGAALSLVNRYRCKDGSYRSLEWRSVARVERGLVYAAARDVTDRKTAEELAERSVRSLVLAERMASVGTLAAGMAHEINNPLTYVLGNLGLLVEGLDALDATTPELAELREMAAEAAEGAARVRTIVAALSSFARVDGDGTADVDAVVDTAIRLAHNELRHRARVERVRGAPPPVEADEARLGQVVINLLLNAAQAIPAGDVDSHAVVISTSTDSQGRAVIEVRDTGTGIPPEVIDRIFDPFFTTKPVGVGTGLGLFVSHAIVTAAGGELTVRSEPGRGTSFRVTLPAASRSLTPPPPARARGTSGHGARAQILVVDDDEAVCNTVRRQLAGHEVTVASRAAEALERLDAGERFDLVLSDVMMPELSGMEFHEALRARHPSMVDRVVFITGGAFTPEARAFLASVPNATLEKPFGAAELRLLVERELAWAR